MFKTKPNQNTKVLHGFKIHARFIHRVTCQVEIIEGQDKTRQLNWEEGACLFILARFVASISFIAKGGLNESIHAGSLNSLSEASLTPVWTPAKEKHCRLLLTLLNFVTNAADDSCFI